MTEEPIKQQKLNPRQGFSGKQVLSMLLISMSVAIVATAFAIKLIFFPSPFTPVELSQKEEQQLEAKLDRIEELNTEVSPNEKEFSKDGTLLPERYTENGTSREINFTERELNAMVAKNTNLAGRLAIDLSEDTISIKLLIPMDPDFPMLGGKILKVKAGAELAYREGKPVIKLRGVSLMGIPIPNAWLGGIKNIDLVKEFGSDHGFWKAFADGVDSIDVVEGKVRIRLKK